MAEKVYRLTGVACVKDWSGYPFYRKGFRGENKKIRAKSLTNKKRIFLFDTPKKVIV